MSLQITPDADIISISCKISSGEQMSAQGIHSTSLNIDIQIAVKSVLIVASFSNFQLVALFIHSCSHCTGTAANLCPKALHQ